MDGVGGEVSYKIKAAIKAKLVELGAYVDDELPDYIMVMVANKRTRKQMEDDLSLFLNTNTKVFTTWLHTVLQKLQEVTVQAKDKKESEAASKKLSKKKKATKEAKEKPTKVKEKDKVKKKHTKKSKEKDKKEKKKGKKDKNKEKIEPKKDLSDWEDELVLPPKEANGQNSSDPKNLAEPTADLKETSVEIPEDVSEALPIVEADDLDLASRPSAAEMDVPTAPQVQPLVMAPTVELMKEHDALNQKASRSQDGVKHADEVLDDVKDTRAVSHVSSDSSVSPEELRRQLLLSRAKKKMEERNIESRMRSNSPEVIIVEEAQPSKPAPLENQPKPVSEASQRAESPQLSINAPSLASLTRSPPNVSSRVTSIVSSSRVTSQIQAPRMTSQVQAVTPRMTSQVQAVVTRPAPPEPGVASVVKVKPREFAPTDKQANKNLILKAVAAAERSVAHAPHPPRAKSPSPPKQKPRGRALYTSELRNKRFHNFEVQVPNDANQSKDEEFISSKPSDRNESYIHSWLDKVEEGSPVAEEAIPETTQDDVPEVVLDEDALDDEDEKLSLEDTAKLVVTVGGLKTQRRKPTHPMISPEKTISDRFSAIKKDDEDHEFKDKFREFERKRLEKRAVRGPASKNKTLIAQLSMKFGQIDRVFDDEDSVGVRKRLGYLNRAFEQAEKSRSDDGKDHKKKPEIENRGIKRRLDGRDDEEGGRLQSVIVQPNDRRYQTDWRRDDSGGRRRYDSGDRKRSYNGDSQRRRKRSQSNESNEERRRWHSPERGSRDLMEVQARRRWTQEGAGRDSREDESKKRRSPVKSTRDQADMETRLRRLAEQSGRDLKGDSGTRWKGRSPERSSRDQREEETARRRHDSHESRERRDSSGSPRKRDRRDSEGSKKSREESGRKRDRSAESNADKRKEAKREKRSVRVSADYDELVPKSMERCRFWPDCNRGSSCDFHHPISICKDLPDCVKSATSCLYIHPMCKKDRDCSITDCPYQHSEDTSFRGRTKSKMMCKYDSYCKNRDCQYEHTSDRSRNCKFGSRCTNQSCSYLHTTTA